MMGFDETRFFKNPRRMTDAELEKEYQHITDGTIEREFLDADIALFMKDEIRAHVREVEQEKQRRDEIIYPVNEFLGFPGI